MGNLSPKTQTLLKTLASIGLVVLLIAFFFTKVIGYVAPFLVALLITFIIEKPVQLLSKKLKLPRGLAVAIVLLLFVTLFGGAIIFVFYKLISELWRLVQEISRLDIQPVIDFLRNILERGQSWYFNLPEGLANTIEQTINSNIRNITQIFSNISSKLMAAATYMAEFVVSLPQVLIFIVISLAATYFMSRDRNKIAEFVYKQIPPSWASRLRFIKDDMILALVGFLKAQIVLMSITFFELLIGYLILDVKYAFFFALLTAVVDILPVLGTGTILIPAAIFYFISGNLAKGFGFLILYLTITAIRQAIEPRIVGKSLGLHPLVTLMSMYIGLRLFGVIGIFLGPIVVIIINTLQKVKILPSWKT